MKKDVHSIALLDIQQEKANGIEYLTASSLMDDRFAFASRLKRKDEKVNEIYQIVFS